MAYNIIEATIFTRTTRISWHISIQTIIARDYMVRVLLYSLSNAFRVMIKYEPRHFFVDIEIFYYYISYLYSVMLFK